MEVLLSHSPRNHAIWLLDMDAEALLHDDRRMESQ